MKLSEVQTQFILHWGEMGTRWGLNRTVAQVHALLYLAPHPIHAEAITEALSVARSNVSTSLKELQAWGLVRVVHVLGDRRDHFETVTDVWEMFRIVVDERKRREIDPTLEVLHRCMSSLKVSKSDDSVTAERIGNMLEFFETTTGFYSNLASLSTSALKKFARLGRKVHQLVGKK